MPPAASTPSPAELDDPVAPDADEAAFVEAARATLPEIDFDDPAYTDYLRKAVREALDDPRPSMSLDDAFETIERRYLDDMRRLRRAVQG